MPQFNESSALLFKTAVDSGICSPEELANRTVLYLSYDSRTVKEGTLFFCKGLKFDPKYLSKIVD